MVMPLENRGQDRGMTRSSAILDGGCYDLPLSEFPMATPLRSFTMSPPVFPDTPAFRTRMLVGEVFKSDKAGGVPIRWRRWGSNFSKSYPDRIPRECPAGHRHAVQRRTEGQVSLPVPRAFTARPAPRVGSQPVSRHRERVEREILVAAVEQIDVDTRLFQSSSRGFGAHFHVGDIPIRNIASDNFSASETLHGVLGKGRVVILTSSTTEGWRALL